MQNTQSAEMDERTLRRLAIQIAGQLPNNEADALRVLELTSELVSGFMEGRPKAKLRVVKDQALRREP